MIIIFDLEGVLIDNRERLQYAANYVGVDPNDLERLDFKKKHLFWRVFLDASLARKLDRVNPLGISILIDRYKQGKKIIILSGAPKEIVLIHLNKIRQHLKEANQEVKIYETIWRPKGDKTKAPEFKTKIIKNRLLLTEEEIEEIHDDSIEVIEAFRGIARKRFLWKNGEIYKVFED